MRTWCLALLAPCLLASYSLASIGDKIDNAKNDMQAFAGHAQRQNVQEQVTVAKLYSAHRIATADMVLTEYAGQDGTVFAIAWSKARHNPDLSLLLGSRFSDYERSLQSHVKTPGRRPDKVKGGDIVVVHGGHMLSLSGLAYAPALVPPGLDMSQIR